MYFITVFPWARFFCPSPPETVVGNTQLHWEHTKSSFLFIIFHYNIRNMKQFASTPCEHHQENYTLQSHYIKTITAGQAYLRYSSIATRSNGTKTITRTTGTAICTILADLELSLLPNPTACVSKKGEHPSKVSQYLIMNTE